MELACLDLEGVLVPEIWIAFAERTGIDELRATTRDIPDYNVLMKQRLGLLDQHGLNINDIQEVIASLEPLPGAIDFISWLRERFQVIILSDTFYEFFPAFDASAALAHPVLPPPDYRRCGPRRRLQVASGRSQEGISASLP